MVLELPVPLNGEFLCFRREYKLYEEVFLHAVSSDMMNWSYVVVCVVRWMSQCSVCIQSSRTCRNDKTIAQNTKQ